MKTTCTKGIDNVDQTLWKQLTDHHPFASAGWCRYGEAVLDDAGYYVMVHDDDRVIAGAIFWVIYRDDFPIENKMIRRVFDWYIRHNPMLVARTAIRTDYKGVFLPADRDLANQALHEIMTVAHRLLQEHGCSFFFADYFEADELDLDWGDVIKLKNFLEVGTKLELPYETYDDYLLATKARKKKHWKNIRHNTRKAHKRGLSVVIDNQPPPRERLHDMLYQQRAKYDALNPNNYEMDVYEQSALLPDDMRWIKIYQDETELVGAELAFICQQTGVYYPGLFGRDADVDYVYFLAYYTAIRYAIEQGATVMIGNSGSEHFKVRLGFIADRRNNLIFYPASPIARALARWIVRVIRSQPDVSTATPPDQLDDDD